MVKCMHIITKGKKKGEVCNCYTSIRSENGKYYCTGHRKLYNKLKSNSETKDLKIESNSDIDDIHSIEEIKSLEAGHSLEEVIDSIVQNTQAKSIEDRLDSIEEKLSLLQMYFSQKSISHTIGTNTLQNDNLDFETFNIT